MRTREKFIYGGTKKKSWGGGVDKEMQGRRSKDSKKNDETGVRSLIKDGKQKGHLREA